eukprot:TRINITY_DN5545_c0_g4_i1.p1 TRINITY_DN5545_c0_g4~~TRINITY_DN5545_c0_g4_i1.p1  ORF type:complete len:1466 (+),score=435.00 TRINITY_DN5545_c0_g4_i1:255-4400(+)
MGDLWMPAARDRIKGLCMAGHFGMTLICSQHFLARAAQMVQQGQDYMPYMEAAYSHMIAMRNMGQAHQLRSCMGQQGWPINVGAIHAYTVKWIGPEHSGTAPVGAFMNGQIDPYGMMFDGVSTHTARSRLDALPDRRPCVPFKEPRCWKRMSKLLMETCEHCCSPFIHKSGRGDPWCFDDVWTYERCCNTDFKDLICDLKRKGEEGGCVDCKKTVTYECLTWPEKRLKDAQDNYNTNVDKFNSLQNTARTLAKDIEATKVDLVQKEAVYREKHGLFNQAVHIWSTSFNNRSRLMSAMRLDQQKISWNNSFKALKAAEEALMTAKQGHRNASEDLAAGRREEAQAKDKLHRNETAHANAKGALVVAERRLEEARGEQRRALAASTSADEEALRLVAAAEATRARSLGANRSFLAARARAAPELDVALAALRAAQHRHAESLRIDGEAEAIQREAQQKSDQAHQELASASRNLSNAEQFKLSESTKKNASEQGLGDIARERLNFERKHEDAVALESSAHEALMGEERSEAMRCLIAATPANASVRPRPREAASPVDDAKGGACAAPEDTNEFCATWANEGECKSNPAYMLRACAKSCSSRLGVAASCRPRVAAAAAASRPQSRVPMPPNLDALVAELAAAPAVLLDENETTAADLGVPAAAVESVPEEFLREVTKTQEALKKSQERSEAAMQNVSHAREALEVALREEEDASKNASDANATQIEATKAKDFAVAEEERYESQMKQRDTEKKNAEQALDSRRDELRRLGEKAKEAKTLEEGLENARRLADEESATKASAVDRLRKQISHLEDQYDTLNSSISENMTTVVSAWLQDREEEKKEETGGLTARLLAAAKSALVSMVSSVEMFLERYVVSLKDREMILELVQTVEDLKSARKRLKEAEGAAASAEVHASDAAASVAKAVVARKNVEDQIQPAESRVQQAEEALVPAVAALELAQEELVNAIDRLAAAREVLAEADELLAAAVAVLQKAQALRERRSLELRAAEATAEAAVAAVEAAVAAVSAAKVAHREAVDAAERAFLSHLQRHCKATDEEFDTYKEAEDLLSFLRALTLARRREVASAKQRHEETAAKHSLAVAALDGATRAAAAALQEREARAAAAEAADGVKSERDARRQETRTDLNAKLEVREAREGDVLRVREKFSTEEKHASQAVQEHSRASAEAAQMVERRNLLEAGLARALNASRERSKDLDNAEQTVADTLAALEAARIWQQDYNASLLLEDRVWRLDQAIALEKKRDDTRERRLRRERRMHALQLTHQRHLDLIETQEELKKKEEARIFAKSEFDKAEKAFVDTQEKLDKLIKDEGTTNKNVHDTHAALQKLLKEHEEATKMYNEQDPEDRKRSFATSLSGSGADPG